MILCVFRCAQRVLIKVRLWAASSKVVPTSTTTDVLWSQVRSALCHLPFHSKQEQSNEIKLQTVTAKTYILLMISLHLQWQTFS